VRNTYTPLLLNSGQIGHEKKNLQNSSENGFERVRCDLFF
jgi:hypothetical protein